MGQKIEKTIEEKANSEEWGAWKFVSEMLDNPNEGGIYPTSKCYEQIYDFVVKQKTLVCHSTYQYWRDKIKADLLAIANEGEFEDMRREVENYFKN